MISTELIANNKKFNSKNPFWVNYFEKIKSLKKVAIVMSILHLLGLPLLFISYISSEVSTHGGLYGFIPLSIACLCGALFCGFIIAISDFDYLYKKSNVDMVYSLPLTNSQHFLSDFFAGLSVYLVPYILSVIFTFIINVISKMIFTSAEIQIRLNFISTMFIKLAIAGLILMIMFYTLTVLITCCCGSLFETIAYNIIANGLIPGVIAVFFMIFFDDIYGISVEKYLVDYISCSSPIGSLIGLVDTLSNSINIVPLIRWYIMNFAFDVIYFFLAMFLYSRRKAEDVSKPFVFKSFYYGVVTLITFIIVAIAIKLDDLDETIPMIVFSAIVYFIFEVSSNRGFKKFYYSIARYVGTLVGVVIFTFIISATNGFGVENKVPTIGSVRSVSINYGGLYDSEFDQNLIVTDKDSIQSIIDFHKEVLKNKDTYNDNYVTDDEYYYYNKSFKDIDITYTTLLGRNISRSYNVSLNEFMMLKNLSLNKNYIKQSVIEFKDNLINNYFVSNDYNATLPIKNREYYINVSSKLDINSMNYNLTYSQIIQLTEAYRKDLQNRTLDDIMQPEDTYCILSGYTIFSSYENTINFLTKNKFTPSSLESSLSSYNYYDYDSIKLYSPSEIVNYSGYISTKWRYSSSFVLNENYGKQLYVTDKNFIELLKVAQPYYITTDKCYILKFDSKYFIIPSKYTDIAERCYQSNKVVSSIDYDSSSYGKLKAIWNKYSEFKQAYPEFTVFIDDLMKGILDTSIATDTNDYQVLERYINWYWNIYYDSAIQDSWNDNPNDYPNYDDFVWNIINNSLDNSLD